jgi:hypothetical protein
VMKRIAARQTVMLDSCARRRVARRAVAAKAVF